MIRRRQSRFEIHFLTDREESAKFGGRRAGDRAQAEAIAYKEPRLAGAQLMTFANAQKMRGCFRYRPSLSSPAGAASSKYRSG